MTGAPRERLTQRVVAAFVDAYDSAPTAVARAPGRVNLIGEHTDYNGGFVLPCAIDYETKVAAAPRDDQVVRVLAADLGGATDEFRLDAPIVRRPDAPWADYVRGMVWSMREAGVPLQGAELAIAGNVPQGAGLSSSASLQVALGQAFKLLSAGRVPSPTQLALLAQRAENDFVGCRCGVMDQLASACGVADHALLIDCRAVAAEPVPLPPGLAVMVVHSRVQRGLVDSEYNLRRQQCEAAARALGVPALRDADITLLRASAPTLDAQVQRRARHVITENARTLQAARALAAGDLQQLGVLMAASHASMRDDFEITVPAIDALVELTQAAIGSEGGARMTGGGFGGCIVALMPRERAAVVADAIEAGYRSPHGEPALIWLCSAQDGASAVRG